MAAQIESRRAHVRLQSAPLFVRSFGHGCIRRRPRTPKQSTEHPQHDGIGRSHVTEMGDDLDRIPDGHTLHVPDAQRLVSGTGSLEGSAHEQNKEKTAEVHSANLGIQDPTATHLVPPFN